MPYYPKRGYGRSKRLYAYADKARIRAMARKYLRSRPGRGLRTRLPISSTGVRVARGPRGSTSMERLRSKMGELKTVTQSDTAYSTYVQAGSPLILDHTAIAQGVTKHTRVGDVIYPVKVNLKLRFKGPTAAISTYSATCRVRVISFQWYDTGTPTPLNLLRMVKDDGVTGLNDQWETEARYEPNFTGMRAILSDKTYDIIPEWYHASPMQGHWGFVNQVIKPKVIAVKYDNPASTDGRNKLYTVVFTNIDVATAGHRPAMGYETTLYYRD